MPISLDEVTGLLDAAIVDGNFEELENYMKENISKEDFSGRISKYKLRQYTAGRITSFNFGARPEPGTGQSVLEGTFENNWVEGVPAVKAIYDGGKSVAKMTSEAYQPRASYGIDSMREDGDSQADYSDPLGHPYELLGFPGGSLYYDFQEQGLPDPVTLYSSFGLGDVGGWPPEKDNPLNKFPRDQCWSRWLTIPDAAGSVFVDEPCIAVITATVKGNYFFTPALRVHGSNTSADNTNALVDGTHVGAFTGTGYTGYSLGTGKDSERKVPMSLLNGYWKADHRHGKEGMGIIEEGMQHSAQLRLGLFVDTNPIVWEDEFNNGDAYGNNTLYGAGKKNPWIGENPTGEYSAANVDGVADTRSWKKITDISMAVRQKGTYKVIGFVELKGRRKYNFSLKMKPAMYFGWVGVESGQAPDSGLVFHNNYFELNAQPSDMPDMNSGMSEKQKNTAWMWDTMWEEFPSMGATTKPQQNYFWPGGDALVTNMVDSSSLSVDFFYGQTLKSVMNMTATIIDNADEYVVSPSTSELED
tara:strand:+ start:5498 stop:7087 length:1590 start_codon:yes stop_codon:yes gene_type:complete